MKKILLIDDKTVENPLTRGISTMADKWRTDKTNEFADYVEIVVLPNNHFEWDSAGNFCNPKFNIDDYAYVFIHHSQRGDSMLPSTIIDLIKSILGEKLVLFSGSIGDCYINTESDGFTFRSITRQKLWDGMREFVRKSILLEEWTIELLFYDYETFLIGKIMEMQDQGNSNQQIFDTEEMKRLLRLK